MSAIFANCRHIESVFRTPYLKMWKFSELRVERTALISCIYRYGILYAIALYYTGVGHY